MGSRQIETTFFFRKIYGDNSTSIYSAIFVNYASDMSKHLNARLDCSAEIARSLCEGFHFSADWRHQVVEQRLVRTASAAGASEDLHLIEPDPFVRQAFRYRLTGDCVNRDAFHYAYQTRAHNSKTGAGSLLKAMSLADLSIDEIAGQVGAPRRSVAAYLKLFFDVEPYLDCEMWIRLQAMPFRDQVNLTPEQIREDALLATAFSAGRQGLDQMLFLKASGAPSDNLLLFQRLSGMVGNRMLRYVQNLETRGVPPSTHDVQLWQLVNSQAALAGANKNDGLPGSAEWVTDVVGMIDKNAQTDETMDPEVRQLFLPGGELHQILHGSENSKRKNRRDG